jgi:hypothetical protein
MSTFSKTENILFKEKTAFDAENVSRRVPTVPHIGKAAFYHFQQK